MEKKTTREHYIQSLHELIAVNAAWQQTEPKTDERVVADRNYENALGSVQIRASRLGYHESQAFVDCIKIREGRDVN